MRRRRLRFVVRHVPHELVLVFVFALAELCHQAVCRSSERRDADALVDKEASPQLQRHRPRQPRKRLVVCVAERALVPLVGPAVQGLADLCFVAVFLEQFLDRIVHL